MKLKVSEYIGLIQAGYTPEEIAAFEKESEDPKPAGDPKPAEDPKPAAEPKPAGDQKPEVTPDAAERIEKAVADFTKALQSFNLANARQPGGGIKDPRDEATEIMTKWCNM